MTASRWHGEARALARHEEQAALACKLVRSQHQSSGLRNMGGEPSGMGKTLLSSTISLGR